ncbi:MAG: PKD domain-containing protein [Ferruginibacter sp.]
MYKFLLSIIFLLSVSTAFATHISGGEMSYIYLGPGTTPGTLKYQVNLTMYKDCAAGGADLDDFVTFTVYQNSNGSQFLNIQNIAGMDTFWIRKIPSDPCIADNIENNVCFIIRKYSTIIDNLPLTAAGYTVAYQRCCRVPNMTNITSLNVGITYFAKIPGNNFLGAETNTSPVFVTKDTVLICSGRPINFDFSATDADNDSLVYRFYNAFSGGGNTAGTCFGCITPDPASIPPYIPVSYINGYTPGNPLGPLVTINSNTGLISGITPNLGVGANQIFAITVLVSEYRNGVKIGEHFKDLQIRVVDCQIPTAILDPVYITCDGFTLTFENNTPNNPVPAFYWEFDDPISGVNNSSSLAMPTHTFTDTGIYKVKLVLNRGLQCADSTTTDVKVYPGFFPGFEPVAPFCVGQPVSFIDTTSSNYGTVSYWSWNFGNTVTLADTSHQQNPQYTYTSTGAYHIELIVANSKGCQDTVYRDVTVLGTPAISLLPNDTSYCKLDSLQLTATGTGTFSWFPNTSIVGASTATPLVFPSTPTTYIVTIDVLGCKNRDSVRITPLNDLTNAISANPSSICQQDTLTLTGSSNKTANLSWQWSPVSSVLSPTSQITKAFPLTSTTYTLTTKWGAHCVANTTLNIPVTPLAIPNAGPDTAYCTGQTPVQLSASGGNSYQWSPAAGLNNALIANPLASPAVTTKYAVSVGVAGCSRRKIDSVLVVVHPKPLLSLTNDTLICSIDTIQLNAAGAGNVAWAPDYNINSTSSHTPLVSPDVPTVYYVRLTDINKCFKDDSVFVDVKLVVTVDAGPDTSICKTEGYTLRTTSDALHFLWQPSTYLNYDTLRNPYANPPVTTTYSVTANIGKCQSESQVTIKVAPYPDAQVELVPPVCIGFSTQLTATGGSIYSWSPSTYLSSSTIPGPQVLQPLQTTMYVVSVSDTLGCIKVIRDSVLVKVIPKLHVNAGPRDTTIVEGETIRLNATGATTYSWSPSTWLSGTDIANPLSSPDDSISYIVIGTDINGCRGTDTIDLILFHLEADMYVPTAFTPNNDGTNDVIRPILLGMRSLTYFRVFNRFGELMFETSQKEKGWNGIYKGKPQDPATFVWMAEGVTYKGLKRSKKGFVVLIR